MNTACGTQAVDWRHPFARGSPLAANRVQLAFGPVQDPQPHLGDSFFNNPELLCGPFGQIDDPSLDEWAAVIDPYDDAPTGFDLHHPDNRSERKCLVSGTDPVHVVDLAIGRVISMEPRPVPRSNPYFIIRPGNLIEDDQPNQGDRDDDIEHPFFHSTHYRKRPRGSQSLEDLPAAK